MSELNSLKSIVYLAVDQFNLSQESENHLDKNEKAMLFSRPGYTKKGNLDSLSLVYFLVTVEECLQKEYINLDLKIQELIDSKEVNLENISSLILYIKKLL